jgi:hypothetical protein
MNTRIKFTGFSVAILILLLAANTAFAQQAIPAQKTETVIFKLQKKDYTDHSKTLQQSLNQITGVTVNKFCDKYEKIFLILQVDRNLQPTDDNIVVAINTSEIGFKKVDKPNIQDIVNFCN